MPRLPDVQSYGPRPAIGPQRQVVGYQTPSIAAAEATALDLSPVGNVLSEQAARMYQREDALDRITKSDLYEAEVADEMRSLEASGDLSSKDTIAAYGELLSTRKQALLSEHRGSAESRAMLDADLSDIRSRYAGQVAVQSAMAQRAKVTGKRDAIINTMAARAGQNPGAANDLIVELDRRIDSLAGAMSPEDDAEARREGRAMILATSAETLLDRGNVEGARLALADPQAAALIPADTMRRLQARAADQTRSGSAIEIAIAQYEGIKGSPATQAERMEIARKAVGLGGGESEPLVEVATPNGAIYVPRSQAAGKQVPAKAPLVQVGDQGPKMGAVPAGYVPVEDPNEPSGYRLVAMGGSPAALEAAASDEFSTAARVKERTDALNNIRSVDVALNLFKGGAGGAFTGSLPDFAQGFIAPDTLELEGAIKTVLSEVTLSRMQALRATSPTGSTGFGALSQKELEVFQFAMGQLDSRLPERSMANLETIRRIALDALYGSDEEHERALDDGTKTEAEIADLKRQRDTIGFDVMGQQKQAAAAPAPSEAAGKPIAEMDVTELQTLVLDPARMSTLSDAELAELAARLRGEGMSGTAKLVNPGDGA